MAFTAHITRQRMTPNMQAYKSILNITFGEGKSAACAIDAGGNPGNPWTTHSHVYSVQALDNENILGPPAAKNVLIYKYIIIIA